MKKFIKILLAAALILGLSLSSTHASNQTEVGVTVSGGAFFNDKLKRTAGREHQIKMSDVILSLSGQQGRWGWFVEGVVLGDEMYVDSDDSAYNDIYTNLGTSMFYYGDHPIREAWVSTNIGTDFQVKVGRMSTLTSGPNFYQFSPYSPHSVILHTGLFNGVRLSTISSESFQTSVSLLWGRDRPCFDGQCYLGGKLDVNEKGNNTPVIEVGVSSAPISWLNLGVSGLVNKTGSAPGSFTSGKHNDSRVKAFADVHLYGRGNFSLDLYGQYNYFLLGLTEDGVQGERTPAQSHNIKRRGWFVSPSFSLYPYTFRYTYEQLERGNASAFKDVAKFNPSHPIMSEVERRHIYSFGWEKDSVEVQVHYTTEEVSSIFGGDEFGITFRLNI